MTKHNHLSAIDIENKLRAYLKDAALAARTGSFRGGSSELDGIRTVEQLSSAILELGEAYIEKMKAISKAAPIVRGNTISIYNAAPDANYPSKEDELFLAECRKMLVKDGFVRAADADTYEKIAKRYPGTVFPSRVRGSEAKKFLSLRSGDALTKALKKRR